MPGAYAHITAVNIASETYRVQAAGISREAAIALGRYKGFLELGAVSPDYPYLDVGFGSSAKKWADKMHYTNTGFMVGHGIEHLFSVRQEAREKCIAWLLGYAAHLVADLTIHPIVELRVGPYHENAADHRTCEMHQDAYIFNRMNVGEVGASEHLDSGISRCCGKDDSSLDEDIKALWLAMLSSNYPDEFETNRPDPDSWHSGFKTIVDTVEEGYKLFPIARHVAADKGLTYPARENIDSSFIEELKTPSGTAHYDEIFDRAVSNIIQMWKQISDDLNQKEPTILAQLGNWNLDTGRDENGQLVYWGVA